MQIRSIREADVKQCLAIYNDYIANTCYTFEEALLEPEQFRGRVFRITRRFPYFVAVRDGQVLGYAYLDAFHERSAYRYTADLSVYVDRRCVQMGVGSVLLAEIERSAKEVGLKNIISVIASCNEGSVRFHEKHGFRCMGELENVGYKFHQWLSVQYYQKML